MRKYIYLFLLMGLGFAGRTQDMQPIQLQCEYRTNPLGMDEVRPRLSWGLESDSNDRYQSAYRVLVATSQALLDQGKGDFWDSGEVADSTTMNIVPGRIVQAGIARGAIALLPFTRYYWKVMVWDQHRKAQLWSAVAWFETGMLRASNWQGKWIGDGKPVPSTDADFYKDDPAPVFRKGFVVAKKVQSARLYISGLGYNESSINGKRVGDAVLDPAWTEYGHTVFYSVYDVGGMLKAGNNVIDVLLGNGWYNPLPLRFWGRLNFREALTIGRPKVLANLRIVYADGSVETMATDERWQAGGSGILRNNVFLGETIDGRRKVGGWAPAVVVAAPGGKLVASMMPPIKVRGEVAAVHVSEPSPGVYVVDMGRNFAGVIRMRMRGRAGQVVHLRYGEILQGDGRVNGLTTVAGQIKEVYHLDGGPGAPPTAYQEDEYVCKGDGADYFHPHFTFHGFRYVEITGLDRPPLLADVVGLPMSTDVSQQGVFECNDRLLRNIQEMVTNTFLSNLFSVQSDCPGREKQGYGGDIVATADAFMFNFDMSCFYPKTLGDFADAVRPNGGMTECAPYNGIADEGFGEGTGPIGWQLAFPFLQRELYRFYGNKRVVEEQYDRTVRQVEFLRGQAKDGLIDHGIGDHEAVNSKHVPVTSGAFYYGHVKLLAELAGLLGKAAEEARWLRLADSVGAAFNLRYLQADRARYDTAANQTTQVFPLWWGIAKDSMASFNALVRLIEDRQGHLSTGIFGTKLLWDVMRRFGRNDLALRIATQRGFPGYGYMLDHGATTLIESWALTDQNSWNHPMFGSVSEWFYRGLAGINPAEDACGMDKLVFRVQPMEGVNEVKALYQSVRGGIFSMWSKSGNEFVWKLRIPPNVRAEVDVPAMEGDRVEANGNVVDRALWKDGFYRVAIGSGRYQFVVKAQ
jgi:alpha-L-rhamnosidase